VHSVAVDVAIALHDVPEMNSDSQFDSSLARDIVIALRERPLNLNRTLYGLERTAELEQESVTNSLNLGAAEAGENFPQHAPVFLEQLKRVGFVALRQRAVSDHVGKNDRGELALFDWHRGFLLSDFPSKKQCAISGEDYRFASRRFDIDQSLGRGAASDLFQDCRLR